MSNWSTLATKTSREIAIKNLTANGFKVIEVADGQAAKAKVLELLPQGAEILNNSSTTLNQIGLTDAIANSENYQPVKTKLMAMDKATDGREMKKLGSAPEWTIGSIHALTEDGRALIASATGSQLPGYVYGADHVIWVVGTQKIVKDLAAGMMRIEEYVLPLENERALKAYGVGSSINKLLIVNHDTPDRTTIILVDEVLGF